jgi:peptidyl-prolyl cis-trans isomerase B (cyclophilin B)
MAALAAGLLASASAANGSDNAGSATTAPTSASSSAAAAESSRPGLEPGPVSLDTPRADALPETVSCQYTPSGAPSRDIEIPPTEDVATTGSPVVAFDTTAGTITARLSPAHAPCTVNSFVSLAEQDYFDGTRCHRLTTAGIFVLQCGDPTASGRGGPGYAFADEFPTDQFTPADPNLQEAFVYPRGTVAMANAGPGTNGSQFFLVYEDSPLPPAYTVFGALDEASLAVIDAVAAGGATQNGRATSDGAPATPVEITTATVS